MKASRLWVVGILGFHLLACHAPAAVSEPDEGSDLPLPASLVTRKDVEALYERFEYIDAGLSLMIPPQDKPREYRAENVLRKIHPALELEDRNDAAGNSVRLLKRTRIGDYEFLELKPILRILPEIMRATFGTGFDSGFAFLQADFWAKLADLQENEHLRVGFVARSPETIAGIYDDRAGFIGIDLFANSGTLTHELRHREQQKRISEEDRELQFLDEACAEAAKAYFGELDATTVQLRTWIPAISDLKNIPDDASQAARIGEWVSLSTPLAFSANLEYPISAAEWVVREKSCPKPLVDAVSRISILAHDEKSALTGGDFGQLSSVWFQAVDTMTRVGPDSVDGNSRLASLKESSKGAKTALTGKIENLSRERITTIRKILLEVKESDPALFSELRRISGGFSLLTDSEYSVAGNHP